MAEESTSEGQDKHPTTEDKEAKVISDTNAQLVDPIVEPMSSAQEKRAVDDLLKAVPVESPIHCMRDCLEASFTVTSIRSFCQDNFYYVHKRFEDAGFEKIILAIIDYCLEKGEEERFWQIMQRERSNHYNRYYPRWKKAIEHAHYDSHKIDQLNTTEYSYSRDEYTKTTSSSDSNPLEKDLGELTRWFFKELQHNERSLLLTAALFEGMSRQKMLQIAKEMEIVFLD